MDGGEWGDLVHLAADRNGYGPDRHQVHRFRYQCNGDGQLDRVLPVRGGGLQRQRLFGLGRRDQYHRRHGGPMKRILLASLALVGGFAPQARAADTVYYYYNDAQGSPVAVTDAHGAVVERTQYAPYGQVLNRPEHDGPGYTKHEEDAATGLTNMQQRYDDKVIGRMLSMDPMDVETTTDRKSTRLNS